MRLCLQLLFLTLWPFSAGAQSIAFEPARSSFSDYNHEYRVKVRDILLKGVTHHPDVMLVSLPSFYAESAIVLIKGRVIHLECSKPIWGNKAPNEIEINEQEFAISSELASAIHALWFDALGTTAYPELNRGGLDGASYHFTAYKNENRLLREGTAWCPDYGSLPSDLITILYSIRNRTDEDNENQTILTFVKTLHKKLLRERELEMLNTHSAEHASGKSKTGKIKLQEENETDWLLSDLRRGLGAKIRSHRNEWEPFIKAEFSPGANQSTLQVTLFYEKDCEGLLVPVIIMNSPEYHQDNLLYRKEHRVEEVTAAWLGVADPFNDKIDPFDLPDPSDKDETAQYGITFEVDRRSLNKVYIGGILRPNLQIKSLKELIEYNKKESREE